MIKLQDSTIGECCEVIAGQSPEGKYYNSEGKGMPFYQGKKDFGEKFIEEPSTWTTETPKVARKSDILMSVRAPVGPVNFATQDVCIGRGLAAIRSKGTLEVDFLFYQLLHLQPKIAGKEGAVFASINKSEIAALPIVVGPLSEQRRIVAILDEAFDGIATAKANAEKNLQNAREWFETSLSAIFESHLQSVFTQRGDEWVSTTIGKSCVLKSGTTVPVSIEKTSGDIPYVKVAEMTLPENQDGITTSIRFLNRDDVKTSWLIPAGSVIFPKRGGAILTNKKRLALVDMCADLNIMSVIPAENLNPEFLYFYFLTVDMRKLGTGSSIPQINNYDIAPLEISFPESTRKQAEIAEFIRSLETECQALESVYQRKIAALNDLKKSLLHQAFAGLL